MTKDRSAKSLPSSVLDDGALRSSAFESNLATVAVLNRDGTSPSTESRTPDRGTLAALKRWIKKRAEAGHPNAHWDLMATNILGGEHDAHHSNTASVEATRLWPSLLAFNNSSNAPSFGFLFPKLDSSLHEHWRHILQLGLDSEFEDGVPSSFDDELDSFLMDDTATRILFAWSALQSTPDNQYIFYRFIERIGYSPSVDAHIVPNGLLSSALQSRVPGVRAAAAHALGTIGDSAAFQTLQEWSFIERNAVVAEIIHRHLKDHVSAAPDQK